MPVPLCQSLRTVAVVGERAYGTPVSVRQLSGGQRAQERRMIPRGT
jgi:hypothetical protein